MDGNSLKCWQAGRISCALYPHLGYLHRLKQRMVQVGFMPDDRLFQVVTEAYDAVHAPYVELQVLSSGSGARQSKSRK